MRSIKVLEMLKKGRIDELIKMLQDDIYQSSLKRRPDAKRRYAAMKKYFSYKDSVRDICQKPCRVTFEGKEYTSFTNSYSLALTTEPTGEIELFDEPERYPNVSRLVSLSGEKGKINFERVIAKAKSRGYKLTKAELFASRYLMHYKGAYYRIALIDSTYAIIADGKEATVYFTERLRPLAVETSIGICIILPITYDGSDAEELERTIIEAVPDEKGEKMSHEEIAELISRRRRQVLVHSIIYYKLNDNLISDSQWSKWALELDELQRNYPDIAAKCVYAEAFEGFDPSTGYSLPLNDPWAVNRARQLVRWAHEEREESNG